MEKRNLSWDDFKPGTLLWLKIVLYLGFIIGVSYVLSKAYFFLGFLFHIYFFLFVSPAFISAIFTNWLIFYILNIIGVLAFPVYLLIAINYFYFYFKKKITIRWLTALFVVVTILYTAAIIAGWLIFLVWHPL